MNVLILPVLLTFMHIPLDVREPLITAAIVAQQNQPNPFAQFDYLRR